MIEWMGLELNTHWLSLLFASPLGLVVFWFPVLIFIAFVVSESAEPLERLARRSERLGRFIDKAREIGPREGWSGYVLGAVVVVFLFTCAALAFQACGGS